MFSGGKPLGQKRGEVKQLLVMCLAVAKILQEGNEGSAYKQAVKRLSSDLHNIYAMYETWGYIKALR